MLASVYGSSGAGTELQYRRTTMEQGMRDHLADEIGDDGIPSASKLISQHEEEKRQLHELNSHFKSYLEKVRDLEHQNVLLNKELIEIRSKSGFDTIAARQQCDDHITDLYENCRKTAIDGGISEIRLQEAQSRMRDLNNDLLDIQLIRDYDLSKVNDLKRQFNTIKSEINNAARRLKDGEDRRNCVLKDTFDARAELDELRKQLYDAMRDKRLSEIESNLLENLLDFKYYSHSQQLIILQNLRAPAIDEGEFYTTALSDVIDKLRDDFEVLTREQKRHLETYYTYKTEEVRRIVDAEEIEEEQHKRRIISENAYNEADIPTLQQMLSKLQGEQREFKEVEARLNSEIYSMSTSFEQMRVSRQREEAEIDVEVEQTRLRIDDLTNAIQESFQYNDSLKFEIGAYKGLLDSETSRLEGEDVASRSRRVDFRSNDHASASTILGLDGAGSSTGAAGSSHGYGSSYGAGSSYVAPSSVFSTSSGGKTGSSFRSDLDRDQGRLSRRTGSGRNIRKRTDGEVEIHHVDVDGRFMSLSNRSSNMIDISGWELRCKADRHPEVYFKFPRGTVIAKNQTIDVHGRQAPRGDANAVSANLASDWPVESSMEGTLINDRGRIISSFIESP